MNATQTPNAMQAAKRAINKLRLYNFEFSDENGKTPQTVIIVAESENEAWTIAALRMTQIVGVRPETIKRIYDLGSIRSYIRELKPATVPCLLEEIGDGLWFKTTENIWYQRIAKNGHLADCLYINNNQKKFCFLPLDTVVLESSFNRPTESD